MSSTTLPEVKQRNRYLGRILTVLVLVLAIGTYLGLQITRFNPFDKPAVPQSQRGM